MIVSCFSANTQHFCHTADWHCLYSPAAADDAAAAAAVFVSVVQGVGLTCCILHACACFSTAGPMEILVPGR